MKDETNTESEGNKTDHDDTKPPPRRSNIAYNNKQRSKPPNIV